MNPGRTRARGSILLLGGCACVCAGVAALLLSTPKWYVATAVVLVDQEGPLDDSGPQIYPVNLIQHECDLVQSQTVLSNAVVSLSAQDPSSPIAGRWRQTHMEEDCARLRDYCNAAPIRSTRLIEVRVSQGDAVVAAQLANAIAQAYCNQPAEGRWTWTRDELASMEKQIRDQLQAPEAEREPGFQAKAHALLGDLRNGRYTLQLTRKLVDPATPPIKQVSWERRLNELLGRITHRYPPPPQSAYHWPCLMLIVLGLRLCFWGFRQRSP